MSTINLPFPPSSLSGHAKGHWRAKAAATKKHRAWAVFATQAVNPPVPTEGDIRVHIRFVPPNKRGDRTNFANRMKPYLDGIAEALGVNDARFLPSYEYADPAKPGRVEVTINPAPKEAQCSPTP
jgi:crossover junction endodeoxyribonuclease RusA